MGWQGESWRVSVTLDAHGGDQEREDDELWDEMTDRLREVASDPRFRQLNPLF